MIKNIVFDMGNVLRDYNPYYVINAYVSDADDAKLLFETIFASTEWAMLDEGTIEQEVALAIWLTQLPNRLHSAATSIFWNWHHYMPNIDDTTLLAKQLHDSGYGIYLLSNAGTRFEELRKDFTALKYMDGEIVSAFHKVLKPNKRIYTILFETYHLIPTECFFIDDAPQNVKAAQALGMSGHIYTGNFEALKAALREVGVEV